VNQSLQVVINTILQAPSQTNINQVLKQTEQQFGKHITTTSQIAKNTKEASVANKLFGQSLFEAGKKFAGWLFIGNMIMSVVRQIRFGINTVKELDAAMVNLKKVTDDTEESYQEFYITAGEVAKQLGKVKQEVIASSVEFARLGYNVKESLVLAEEAMLLSNVGVMSIQESTTALISITKGFGVAVDEQGRNIRNIVDIVNEVGNNFAISQQGIAEALQRSAASLYNAGNTIEQATAIVTAANAVVQDPAKVGTAMKTVTIINIVAIYSNVYRKLREPRNLGCGILLYC
jgi:hypothetical protein